MVDDLCRVPVENVAAWVATYNRREEISRFFRAYEYWSSRKGEMDAC